MNTGPDSASIFQDTDKWGDSTLMHTGFITPDIEASVRFWTEVMGFACRGIGERKMPWLASFMGVPGADVRLAHMHGHGGAIEFIEFRNSAATEDIPEVNQPGVAHVCFRVKDVVALRRDILAAGGSLQGELTEITEGTSAGLRGLYIRDPHGILIELIELPTG